MGALPPNPRSIAKAKMGKGALCPMADPFMQDIGADGAAIAKLEAWRAGKLLQPQNK